MKSLPIGWVDRIFQRFQEYFGDCDDLATNTYQKKRWAELLNHLTAAQIKIGLERAKKHLKFAPTPKLFNELCTEADYTPIGDDLSDDKTLAIIQKLFDAEIISAVPSAENCGIINPQTDPQINPPSAAPDRPNPKKNETAYRHWLVNVTDDAAQHMLTVGERYDRNRYLMADEGMARVRAQKLSTTHEAKPYKKWGKEKVAD